MRFDRATIALFTLSSALLGVSASPAKRQDEVDTISSSSTTTTSATRSVASVGLVVDGSTTFEALASTPTGSTATSTGSSKPTLTFSETGAAVAPTSTVPPCSKPKSDPNPFCAPSDGSTLFYGKTYFATWNPDNYALNATVRVQLRFDNDSSQQVWASEQTANGWGFVSVDMKKEWMQGYSMYNLTFHFVTYDASAPKLAAQTRDGPRITLTNPPPNHYKAPGPTKLQRDGLMIALPVTLGALALIITGLYIGMRKHRTIGLGNIMGRRKGYGVGKSRGQRMGFGKKKGGAIRLEDRDDYSRPQYQAAHVRGDSLGSLVSDDGIRPAPSGNHFRSEIERQKTGR